MHWITAPGTSLPEERRIVTRASQRAARASRACATSARTSARRSSARRSPASNFGENWVSVDPKADYDKTLGRDPRGRRRLPGPVPQRADLPARAHRRGAGRRRASRSSSASSATTSPCCAATADRVQRGDRGRRPASSTCTRRLQAEVPQIDVARQPRRRARATASSRATCAAPRRRSSPARRSATSSRAAGPTTSTVWSTPTTRAQPRRRSATCRSTRPTTGRSRSPTLADVRIRPTPNVIERENASRADRRRRERAHGRDLGAVTHDVEDAPASRRPPAGLPRRAARRGGRAPGGPEATCCCSRSAARARRSSCCCRPSFGSWRLAALLFFTLPMALVGGVLAACAGVGVISLGVARSASSRCSASPRATAS